VCITTPLIFVENSILKRATTASLSRCDREVTLDRVLYNNISPPKKNLRVKKKNFPPHYKKAGRDIKKSGFLKTLSPPGGETPF